MLDGMDVQPSSDHPVVLMGPGRMGVAIAQRLRSHGLPVVACLDGRSAATRARAQQAGVPAVALADVASASIVLSVVPPAAALEVARTLAGAGVLGARGPLFADCNALSPDTMREVEAVVAATGAQCVDAAIVGAPPDAAGTRTPVLYASGTQAPRLALLAGHGLAVHVLDAPVGAASGFKLCFAAISKGLTALVAGAAIKSTRADFAAALHAQLCASLGSTQAWAARQAPMLADKSGRWVDEMEEIARFLQDIPGAARMFEGAAEFYAWLDREKAAADGPLERLDGFFAG